MINRTTVHFSFLFILISLLSCGIKTKLSHGELKWINVYKEGDSLIFKSDKGEFDTSVIIKKEIFYPEYNPGEVHDKYLPQWAVVWYKNKKLQYHSDGFQLITMFKKEPDDKTYLNINYLYSSATILNLKTESIEKYTRGKVYEFDTYRDDAKPYQPKRIFWSEDYGIIKYITHDGVVWERINYLK